MTTPAPPSYAGYRFPTEIISFAVWLYFRFPLSLRYDDEILAARGIVVSHKTIRQWGLKFGQAFANQIRRRLPQAGDKWHLDEVAVKIAGVKHWLWRAVDQDGFVLDVLVQSRRNKNACCANCSRSRCVRPASWSLTSWPAMELLRRTLCPALSTGSTRGSITVLRTRTSQPDD